MKKTKYIYSFIYNDSERDLCILEAKYIFNQELENRRLLSDKKIEPSSSAFIKNRMDIISFSKDYSALIDQIKSENISAEDFKVEYFVFEGDTTAYAERLSKLKDIGLSIEGEPDYHNPKITYALSCYEGSWYFGLLIKNKFAWQKHKQKPRSYSNSITIGIAKALVNIAAKADKEKQILDACCGVGTIMLEACFAGYTIEGCDNNPKIVNDARENLSHFNYDAKIYYSDIKDIAKSYDAAIIDLPYNLLSDASDKDMLHIIVSAAEITDRLVIVSTADISNLITKAGIEIMDSCSISKIGKRKFTRKIWVCEQGSRSGLPHF